jgi:hypothetical protein
MEIIKWRMMVVNKVVRRNKYMSEAPNQLNSNRFNRAKKPILSLSGDTGGIPDASEYPRERLE